MAQSPSQHGERRATEAPTIMTSTITTSPSRVKMGRVMVREKHNGQCSRRGQCPGSRTRRKETHTEGVLGPAWCPFMFALCDVSLSPSARVKRYRVLCERRAFAVIRKRQSEREERMREERAGGNRNGVSISLGEGGVHHRQSYIRLGEATGDAGSARSLHQ